MNLANLISLPIPTKSVTPLPPKSVTHPAAWRAIPGHKISVVAYLSLEIGVVLLQSGEFLLECVMDLLLVLRVLVRGRSQELLYIALQMNQ